MTLTPAQRRQRQEAPSTHGAYSALAPLVASMKKAILKRMGLRQRDLTWAGRELLDSYCRAKAKVDAIDTWLETNPMIGAKGTPAPVMSLYFTALNSSTRHLAELRAVIVDLERGDHNIAAALAALDGEGKR